MNNLPIPAPEALAHSQRLHQALVDEISAAGGWLSFARFMEQLLYAPGLGYYTAGARKFGAAGDFVTAPEMTAVFGQALARQAAQIMAASAPIVLEVGAGSGRLAADLLLTLEKEKALPDRYYILDLSADLRQRQQQTIASFVPHLLDRVEWLDRLPESFSGVVIANELLDAMPAHIAAWREEVIFERGVSVDVAGSFTWSERPASGALLAAAEEIGMQCSLPPGFESEISLAARAWAAEWGHRLNKGALLLIDYGFPRREFYHQQRGRGTLMCHYRHHAHKGVKDVELRAYEIDWEPYFDVKTTDEKKILEAFNKEFKINIKVEEISTNEIKALIEKDITMGEEVMVAGTPTIFVNKVKDSTKLKYETLGKK